MGTKIPVPFLFFPISLCARDAIAKAVLFHIMYWFLLGSSLGKAFALKKPFFFALTVILL